MLIFLLIRIMAIGMIDNKIKGNEIDLIQTEKPKNNPLKKKFINKLFLFSIPFKAKYKYNTKQNIKIVSVKT